MAISVSVAEPRKRESLDVEPEHAVAVASCERRYRFHEACRHDGTIAEAAWLRRWAGLAMPGHDAFIPAGTPIRGGPRARKAGWKMSVTIMRPPQQGHTGFGSAGPSEVGG